MLQSIHIQNYALIDKLDIDFMHNGLPRMELNAVWRRPRFDEPVLSSEEQSSSAGAESGFSKFFVRAGFGILAAQAAYWLYPAITKALFRKRREKNICLAPYMSAESRGLCLNITF